MMRSMFSGVSSLRAHQTRMDVIADNIANVNTNGFKGSRVTFLESLSQNMRGASGPNPATGRAGTNPMQVGLGVNMGSIDTIMTQGLAQRTDHAMHAMIEGPGFFIVQDPSGTFFTRAGNILEDQDRNLNINGLKLMGWDTMLDPNSGEYVINRSMLRPLTFAGKDHMPANSTTRLDIEGNLNVDELLILRQDENGNDIEGVVREKTIFDSLGNPYLIRVEFVRHPSAVGAYTYWTYNFLGPRTQGENPGGAYGLGKVWAYRDGDTTNPVLLAMNVDGRPSFSGTTNNFVTTLPTATEPPGPIVPANMRAQGTLAFNTRGELVGIGEAAVYPDGAGSVAGVGEIRPVPVPGSTNFFRGSSFELYIVPVSGVDPNATFGNVGRSGVPGAPAGSANVGFYDNGDARTWAGNITLNTQSFFQGAGATDVGFLSLDGNRAGVLRDVSIGRDGTIVGRFSNGQQRLLGQIPVKEFRNPAGLERVGNGLWVPTANSGPFDGIGTVGQLIGGALEMSNVDLSQEFVEMITTQRGFQAGSRLISVSDEMLQELVNLRR